MAIAQEQLQMPEMVETLHLFDDALRLRRGGAN